MTNNYFSDPLVSVIIPTYNSEKTFKKTVESVLNQSYQNIEIIIVDDLSKDKTKTLISQYEKKFNNIQSYFKSENKGVADSRNIGIEKAKGKYVAFLDSDDLWCKDKLSKQIGFMEKNKILFSYTHYYVYEKTKAYAQLIESPAKVNYKKMLLENSIGCLTVVFNKEAIGNISIPLIKKRNDYSLWLEILSKGCDGYLYDDFLSIKVNYGNSLSSGSKLSLLKYHYEMFRKHRQFSLLKSLYYTGINGFNFLRKSLSPKEKISIQYLEERYHEVTNV